MQKPWAEAAKSSPPMYVSSLNGRPSLANPFSREGNETRYSQGISLDILEGDIDALEMLLVRGNTKENGNA